MECIVKIFKEQHGTSAKTHSTNGGQALHIDLKNHAHLFDLDEKRLEQTAMYLGVLNPDVHGKNTARQHIDLDAQQVEMIEFILREKETP